MFVSNPSEAHWCALKHLCCFLNGTEGLSSVYKWSEDVEFYNFPGSDYSIDVDERKSFSFLSRAH